MAARARTPHSTLCAAAGSRRFAPAFSLELGGSTAPRHRPAPRRGVAVLPSRLTPGGCSPGGHQHLLYHSLHAPFPCHIPPLTLRPLRPPQPRSISHPAGRPAGIWASDAPYTRPAPLQRDPRIPQRAAARCRSGVENAAPTLGRCRRRSLPECRMTTGAGRRHGNPSPH